MAAKSAAERIMGFCNKIVNTKLYILIIHLRHHTRILIFHVQHLYSLLLILFIFIIYSHINTRHVFTQSHKFNNLRTALNTLKETLFS